MFSQRLATAFIAVSAVALWTPDALGQHAQTVLFGDPNELALTIDPSEQFVHPVTAPYFHEDSFVTSDVRGVYIYHDFPQSSAIGGGRAWVLAAQLRLALTDRLQFVAYKDGIVDFQTGAVDDDGLMDIAAGIKWNFLQDWENQFHAAVGAGYEIRMGNGDVLQNDDEWRLWGSINKGFDKLHLGGTLNLFFAGDRDNGLGNSDRLSWHVHADYFVTEWFSPLLEVNGYHHINDGSAVLPFQGVDVANLGGVSSEWVVTMGLGAELRLIDDFAFRLAYEWPLSDKDDLFGYRWTASVVWSF
ncbi:MAG: hypothetical protein ACYTGP_09790 [Planctomycetota bacterium]|jgi:hypothetical protein